MKRILLFGLCVWVLGLTSCEDENLSPDQVTGTWSWIESQGGLLPPRNLQNSDFRQLLIIEDGTYTDMRADTVADSWQYQLEGHPDGLVLAHPTLSYGSKLIKVLSTDTVTVETFIRNGSCDDCVISTYTRVAP